MVFDQAWYWEDRKKLQGEAGDENDDQSVKELSSFLHQSCAMSDVDEPTEQNARISSNQNDLAREQRDNKVGASLQ